MGWVQENWLPLGVISGCLTVAWHMGKKDKKAESFNAESERSDYIVCSNCRMPHYFTEPESVPARCPDCMYSLVDRWTREQFMLKNGQPSKQRSNGYWAESFGAEYVDEDLFWDNLNEAEHLGTLLQSKLGNALLGIDKSHVAYPFIQEARHHLMMEVENRITYAQKQSAELGAESVEVEYTCESCGNVYDLGVHKKMKDYPVCEHCYYDRFDLSAYCCDEWGHPEVYPCPKCGQHESGPFEPDCLCFPNYSDLTDDEWNEMFDNSILHCGMCGGEPGRYGAETNSYAAVTVKVKKTGKVKTISGKPHTPRKLIKDKDITPEEAVTRLKFEACHTCGTPKKFDAECGICI